MKKNLLLLGTLMLSSFSAMAQSFDVDWVAPEMTIPPTSFATWQMEKTYYLWNVGAQGFYINHQGSGDPYWGTRATVNAEKYTAVKITRTNPGGNTENWEKEGVTDNTGLLVSYVTSKSANMCTFSSDDGVLWTDNNGEANRYFQVVPSGDYYHIIGSPLSKVDMSQSFLVAKAENGILVVNFATEATDNYDQWAFVDADPWLKVEDAAALKAAIEETENEGIPSSAMANDYAVYNNLSSTREQLQNAKARVDAVLALVMAIGSAKEEGVSESALNVEYSLCDNPDATIDQLKMAKTRVEALLALQTAVNEAEAAGVDATVIAAEKADLTKADNTVEQLQASTARVKAVQALREAINYASEKGAAGLDKYEAIYTNPSSTTEELNSAAAQVKDMARWEEIAPIFENIVQGEKNDVTGVFENSDFDAGGTLGQVPIGWDVTYKSNSTEATNIGYQYNQGTANITFVNKAGETVTDLGYKNGEVWVSKFIEAWKDANTPNYLGDGSITQTIPSLPEGTYLLAVDCIANNQGRVSDAENPDGLPDDVQLFAKASLTGKEYTQALATKNGKPEHFEFIFHHEGGSMTLGLRVIGSAEAKMPANWICMDNLELYYFGTGEIDPAKAMLNGDIADALQKYPIVNDDPEAGEIQLEDGKYTTQSYINDYVKAIADAQAATEDYAAHRTNIANAIKNMEDGIAAYEKFQEKVVQWNQDFLEKSDIENFGSDSDEWGDLGDFLNNNEVEGYPETTIEDVINNHELTPAQIEEYINKVDELYKAAFAASMRPGMDCTSFLTNASFAKGFEGWVNNSKGAYGDATLGGLKSYPCVEVYCGNGYSGKVEVYQEITGLPRGVYELTCQAFQRNAQAGNPVTLYMNDKETAVQEISAGYIPVADAVNGENCMIENLFEGSGDNMTYNGEPAYDTGGTTNLDSEKKDGEELLGYYPNGMTGASIAFRAERYEQSAKGLVEDGKLKVGLKGMAEWVLWAQFKLTYLGEDAYGEMLDDAIKEEDAYLAENYNAEEDIQTMTNPALADYQKAIADAKEAQKSNDPEVLKKAVEDLMAAGKAVKENVATVSEFETALIELTAAVNDENAKQAGQDAYAALETELDNYMNLTTEGLKELLAKMETVQEKLQIGDFETKVDITSAIVNPGFEEDTQNEQRPPKGWTSSGTVAAQNQNNSSFAEKVGTYYGERWHQNGTIDLNQTIKALPAGTYLLSAIMKSEDCTDPVLYANDQTTTIGADAKRYSVVVELTETSDITIGVRWSDSGNGWTRFDDFHLTYYGSSENADIITGISNIDVQPAAQKKTRKVLENGRIVIYKNGQKYNVAGQAIK